MIHSNTVARPQPAVSQNVSYTGTAGTSTAVSATTNTVRLVSTTDCFIEITVEGTAAVANTGTYLPAFVPEYFSCQPNAKVSAIQVASAGTLYVTPLV